MVIAFALLCVCCLSGYGTVALMYRRLQSHHPEIWRDLRFPNNQAYPGAAHEKEQAQASLRHLAFMWSDKRRQLNDPYYDRLFKVFALLAGGVGISMSALIVMRIFARG